MSTEEIRFRPPPRVPAAGLRWVLLRAFGPAGAQADRPADPDRAVRTARRLDLAARIAARQDSDDLVEELGPAAAGRLLDDRRQAGFTALRRIGAARRIAAAAAERGIRLVLLKFLALHFSGRLEAGSRAAADIDLLAPESDLEALSEAARALGFEPRDFAPLEHHLPTLVHPTLGPLEIHRSLPGVGPDGGAARLEDLERRGGLAPAAGLPGDCRLPAPEVLVAHALAHALLQHGANPEAYALGRLFGDLIDLGIAGERREELFGRARAWLGPGVRSSEAWAAVELSRLLHHGAAPGSTALADDSAAGLLLRHWLAGTLDPAYRDTLALGDFVDGLRGRRPTPPLAVLRHTVFPSAEQMDKIRGPARGRLHAVLRRLGRPLTLLSRAARYAISWLRTAIRRRGT